MIIRNEFENQTGLSEPRRTVTFVTISSGKPTWLALETHVTRPECEKEGIPLAILQSNTDALLVAIPMIGILFVGFFRLDELFGKPHKKGQRRRQVAGLDENGQPICIDPDGHAVARDPKRR